MTRTAIVLPPVLLAAVLSPACRNADVVTGTYATVAEAREAGAIDRGWIPALVPAGAHDLREAHDLDTNRRWGLFNFTDADEGALRAALKPEPISLEGHTCDVARRIEWWPVMLRGRLQDEQIRATGLSTYFAREPQDLVVAINWKQRRAYYWTNSS